MFIANLNRALIEDLNRALIVPYDTEGFRENLNRASIVPYKRLAYLSEQVLSWMFAPLACSQDICNILYDFALIASS